MHLFDLYRNQRPSIDFEVITAFARNAALHPIESTKQENPFVARQDALRTTYNVSDAVLTFKINDLISSERAYATSY